MTGPHSASAQIRIVALAAVSGMGLSLAVASAAGPRQALLVPIGALAGVALYHASFGFTSAWRRILLDGRSVGLRAQLAMLALTIACFFPLLARGELLGQPLAGFVNPVGPALAIGAFLFGVGMQLGGGCGSGTLYTVGGGSLRMLVTLAAFILGSLLATADPLGWQGWPDLGAHSLVIILGAPAALGTAFVILAALYAVALRFEIARHGTAQTLLTASRTDILHGPWPMLLGAAALASVNVACLLASGHPWGITAAFALWGAKIAAMLGLDVGAWTYWQEDGGLRSSVLADTTSVMNFGVMLGALAAAGLAGRFRPVARIPLRSLLAALLGGLLMGLGARMATGCNIGAFFSGTASGSLHGIAWLLFAVPGNALGVHLRPRFGLAP